ncbi:hypothetical protein ACERIT_14375 [Halopenitus sp. H-Gu1]|uniref:hypothetical protein n=1 Tax=Halopenitus sp. H-Gu1 TaxID=3242697 RepID=UPI00359E9359
MDRRTYLATTGGAITVPLVGCLQAPTDDETEQPTRPWPASEPIANPDGTHHLVVENHTETTETAWIRVVREDGATLVDGLYELPHGRGIEFEDLAAWERTYTIELAIEGDDVTSLEWQTPECGPDSEAPRTRGSRNATVRVEEASDGNDDYRISVVVDECDAMFGPGLPTGSAEEFRLDD